VNSDRISRIEWVIRQCHLLNSIGAEFEQTRPFAGLTIGTGIHLEAKGVALMLTLRARVRRPCGCLSVAQWFAGRLA